MPTQAYAGVSGDIWYITDDGRDTPLEVSGNLKGWNVWAFNLGQVATDTVVAGVGNGGVYTATIGSTKWISVSAELATTTVYALAVAQVEDGLYLYAGTAGQGVYVSTDGGQTWTSAVTDTRLVTETVRALAVDERRGIVYAGVQEGGLYTTTVTNTVESGIWFPANFRLGDPLPGIFALAVDQNQGRVYAGTWGKGVYMSQDWGKTWWPLGGLSEGARYVPALALYPGPPPLLYAGTWQGLWRRCPPEKVIYLYLPLVRKNAP